jgi:hypothetical protein
VTFAGMRIRWLVKQTSGQLNTPRLCQALAKTWDVFSVQKEHPAPAMRVYRSGWREYAIIGKCQDEPLAQFVYCHVQPYVIGEVAFRCTANVPGTLFAPLSAFRGTPGRIRTCSLLLRCLICQCRRVTSPGKDRL